MKPNTVGRVGGSIPQTGPLTSETTQARGLTSGTIMLTLDGELPVEFLTAGDRVVTRDTGVSVVKSIRAVVVTCAAVRLAAGSLGHTRPDRDVILPADQPLLIRDWRAQALFGTKQAMVPASRLVDGEFITDIGNMKLTLYQIEFDAPHIVYADGLELQSTQPIAMTRSRTPPHQMATPAK